MSDTLKWTGPIERLKQAVTFVGRSGNWTETGSEFRFRGAEGEVLTFWSNTGTVSIQGTGAKEFLAELTAELGLQKNTLPFD